MKHGSVVAYACLGLLIIVAWLVGPPGAHGEELTGLLTRALGGRVPLETTRTFGTASEAVLTLTAYDFDTGRDSDPTDGTSVGGSLSSGLYRHCDGAACRSFLAGLPLPAGAVVSRIEIEACDEDGGAQVQFAVIRTASPDGGVTFDPAVAGSTGIADAPGCGFFAVNLAGFTVDNRNNYYLAFVGPGPTNLTRFAAFRVFYRRQVSPAPALATFGDVPTTHLFHRFVEALAAAGITAGCSAAPPRYCPDAPVTRGQMAVFLSRALGLHFAP